MPEVFEEALEERLILLDGAMGTEIYARGVFINRCYDEMNLAAPEMVRQIHEAYLEAGADVLTTNTFGANRVRLEAHGLGGQAEAINREGARIARAAASGRAWVAGSIGPLGASMRPVGALSPGDVFSAFREQALVLVEEGVDLLLLETFQSLQEAWQAFRAARSVADIPLVVCMSFPNRGVRGHGEGDSPAFVARAVSAWNPTALGSNCSNGPRDMLEIISEMASATGHKLAALPNAGLPQVVEGRSIYLAGPEYMGEYARRLAQGGASIVGGCCGTTPATIRSMRTFLASIAPMKRPPVVPAGRVEEASDGGLPPIPRSQRSGLARKLEEGQFAVSVELDPPRGASPEKALEGARLLAEAGVDVVNIADGPRAVARMGPAFLATLVQQAGMEALVHYTCRDRNLLGIQMDLLGAHAVGIRNILAVTGDPPKAGNNPGARPVFELDSVGLIAFAQLLNRGLDLSGQPIGGQTSFLVGAGCNPGAVDPEEEVDRYFRKAEAGAEFFFSQPVFEPEVLARFLDRVSGSCDVPFFVGIMPLASYRNAEFLHNEVPGMTVPEAVRARLKAAGDREAQRQVGIEEAQEALRSVQGDPRVKGVYVFPPFGSYRAVLQVLEALDRRRAVGVAR